MKKLVWILLLLQFYGMHATWVVDWITNQSDLNFVQAARTTASNKGVEIQSISQKLQDTPQSKTTKLGGAARFGTANGCKIFARTPKGESVTIKFLGDATHKVATGRAQDADIDSRTAAGANNKGMMARVILEVQGAKKLIGYYCGYEKENQLFKIVLKGSKGNYQAVITPVALK